MFGNPQICWRKLRVEGLTPKENKSNCLLYCLVSRARLNMMIKVLNIE